MPDGKDLIIDAKQMYDEFGPRIFSDLFLENFRKMHPSYDLELDIISLIRRALMMCKSNCYENLPEKDELLCLCDSENTVSIKFDNDAVH